VANPLVSIAAKYMNPTFLNKGIMLFKLSKVKDKVVSDLMP
jgi:hypothetical protein